MTRAPWNDHIVEPGTDPVPPTYLVEWRLPLMGWRLAHDEDGTPAAFTDEDEADRYAEQLRAETTDDGEPTPYEYRVRRVFE